MKENTAEETYPLLFFHTIAHYPINEEVPCRPDA